MAQQTNHFVVVQMPLKVEVRHFLDEEHVVERVEGLDVRGEYLFGGLVELGYTYRRAELVFHSIQGRGITGQRNLELHTHAQSRVACLYLFQRGL